MIKSGDEVTKEIIETIFSVIDTDGSGDISIDEFIN